MIRALLVSYEFPPKGGTQSQTVANLVRRLAARGWSLTVLTVADAPTAMIDPALKAAIPEDVRVVEAYSLEPTRAVQALRHLRGGSERSAPSGQRAYTSAPSWLIRLVQALFIPDEKIGWKPFAVRAGLEAARGHPIDVVIGAGPPFSGLAVARKIASQLGVPWVADLRDPIVGGYFFRAIHPFQERQRRGFEARTLRSAARVIVATSGIAEGIAKRLPDVADRVSIIPNGFDPEDFMVSTAERTEDFVIAYVGSFQGSIRADDFLEAASRAMELNGALANDLRIDIVGATDTNTDAAIERQGVGGCVRKTGFVRHSKAVAAMLRADVLLLVLGPEPESKQILTGKLPEYLAAGRAILGLVPKDGVAAEVIREARAGQVVPPRDTMAIRDAILKLHEMWRAGSLPTPDPAVVRRFDRAHIAAEYESVITEAMGAPSS